MSPGGKRDVMRVAESASSSERGRSRTVSGAVGRSIDALCVFDVADARAWKEADSSCSLYDIC
jgi:hypothetical protein